MKLIDLAPDLAIGFVALGLIGYLVALGLATFCMEKERSLGQRLAEWFTAHPAQNLGIPCAAIAAFAIVAVLLRAFPSDTNEHEQVELELFSLKFSGPSGPTILWLLCFLGFVGALKVLRSEPTDKK